MKIAALYICLVIALTSMIPSINSATGPLTLKWESQPTYWGQFHPSMGDVNGDGTQEIVVKSGSSILVMNGKTGAKVWTSSVDSVGSSQILELADLNRDGTPEIVYCGSNLSVYARDGKGNLLWKSVKVNGASWPGASIVTGDTNRDGYPEIYVVSQDETAPYTGCITKLDHLGNILARSEICWYPCWGGLALADVNQDGNFKIYLGDRSANSGPGGSSTPYPTNPARGLSCYDANTLKTLWTRPDIPHSTPAPMLIDVNKDGKLDVVANCIINNGAIVIDATTGNNIYNWRGKPINNHAKGTVWDIDLDGHIELISSWGYKDDSSCVKDFTVLDLVTGVIEYRASEVNNYVAFPPTVGDVNGDGYMEILAATSVEQGYGTVGQGMLYIYDHNFNIIQTISSFTYNEQLWEPYCVDCDGDGFNEVLIGNAKGKIWCFDTPSKAPSPALKPWAAWYSQYRQGAATNVPTVSIRTTLFSDGFESSSFSAWTGTSRTSGETLSISTTRYHHGVRGSNFASNGNGGYEKSYAYKSVTSSSELYTRGHFYVSQNGISENSDRINLLSLSNSGGTSVAYAGWRKTSSGLLRWFLSIKSGTSTVTAYSSTTPSIGNWYSVELHWRKGATDGLGELWVNGSKVCSLTNRDTDNYGNVAQVRFGLPELYNCGSTSVYLDCVAFSGSYIGPE